MRIGIDLDEVVADSVVGILKAHNERYGTNLKKEDLHEYFFKDMFGMTQPEVRRELDEFFGTDQLKKIYPMAGSIKAIGELKNGGHELYVITGRGGPDVAETEMWLEHHFPKVFSAVHYAYFLSTEGERREKVDICKETGVDVLIDDHIENALACSAAGVRVLLFDQPWNKAPQLPKNVTRVTSWDEVVKKIG